MYCNNCGTKLPESTRFCTNCGADSGVAVKPTQAQPQQVTTQYSGTQPYSPPPTPYKAKEPIIAVLLSWLLFMGSGHIYAGKISKGIGLMVGGLASIGIMYGGFFMLWTFDFGFVIALMIIGGITVTVIALYAHIDAYRTAKKYNLFLQNNGRPPAQNDKW